MAEQFSSYYPDDREMYQFTLNIDAANDVIEYIDRKIWEHRKYFLGDDPLTLEIPFDEMKNQLRLQWQHEEPNNKSTDQLYLHQMCHHVVLTLREAGYHVAVGWPDDSWWIAINVKSMVRGGCVAPLVHHRESGMTDLVDTLETLSSAVVDMSYEK